MTTREDILSLAVREAIDLLAERKHGHRARSPGHNARLCLESAIAAAPTPPAAEAPGQEPVAVKALEWREVRCSDRWVRFTAETILGNYEAFEWSDGGYGMVVIPGEELTFVTMAEAMSAAQADYEQRVRSALVSAPPTYADAEAKGD